MGRHMKTTIELGDSLLAEAKRVAAEDNTTLRALVEAGLREVLGKRRKRAAPFRLRRVTVKGHGLRPELQGASWQQVRDLAYADPAP
jgi:Arc/MetJ family transcription regulator